MPLEVENALVSSKRAINFDKEGNVKAAIYYYNEAIKYLDLAIANNYERTNETLKWKNALLQYKERVQVLEEIGYN